MFLASCNSSSYSHFIFGNLVVSKLYSTDRRNSFKLYNFKSLNAVTTLNRRIAFKLFDQRRKSTCCTVYVYTKKSKKFKTNLNSHDKFFENNFFRLLNV